MHVRDQTNMNIVLVGGGTGGHFYPLIAVAERLNTGGARPRLYYMGPSPYDATLLAREGVSFLWVPAGKRRRYASLLNFFDPFKTLFGVFVAMVKLFIIYPDAILSKGGYTSVPVVLAAAFLRIPIVVHESDAVVGRANILAGRHARVIVTSYGEVHVPSSDAPVSFLGIPLRRELLVPPSPSAIGNLGIDPERPVILVLGGSQGAERVNALILDALDELLEDFTVIHQTGEANSELVSLSATTLIPDESRRKHYRIFPFLSGALLNDAYHLAHVIVSRAGSNSIYEIAVHGKPSILIPIPEDVSYDQRTNAYAYARTGAATVMEEKNLTDGLLRAEVDRIMQDNRLYESMSAAARSFGKRDAAEQVSALITGIAQEH